MFSLPSADGNFFLRPDRILGAFILTASQRPTGYAEAKDALVSELVADLATKERLGGTQKAMEASGDELRALHLKLHRKPVPVDVDDCLRVAGATAAAAVSPAADAALGEDDEESTRGNGHDDVELTMLGGGIESRRRRRDLEEGDESTQDTKVNGTSQSEIKGGAGNNSTVDFEYLISSKEAGLKSVGGLGGDSVTCASLVGELKRNGEDVPNEEPEQSAAALKRTPSTNEPGGPVKTKTQPVQVPKRGENTGRPSVLSSFEELFS